MTGAPLCIELVAVDLAQAGGEFASAAERARAAGMAAEAGERWLRVRSAVRRELGRWLGEEPGRVEITVALGGKPGVRGGEFSLSHSGGHLVLAWAAVPVGVDLETRVPAEPERLAVRFFSAADAAVVGAADAAARGEVFRRQWVAKEAALKVRGGGLAGQLERAVCRWCGDEVVGVECAGESYGTQAFRLADGTPGAVAWGVAGPATVRWRA